MVHEGGVFQQPQSGGGDGAAQPGGSGRGLHHGGRLSVGQTEGTVVGERFDAAIERNNVRRLQLGAEGSSTYSSLGR